MKEKRTQIHGLLVGFCLFLDFFYFRADNADLDKKSLGLKRITFKILVWVKVVPRDKSESSCERTKYGIMVSSPSLV